MKKNLLSVIYSSLMLVMFVACNKPVEPAPDEFKISASSKIMNLKADEVSKVVSIIATSEQWKAELLDPATSGWLTVVALPKSSQVTITTSVNDDIKSRTAQFRVVSTTGFVADTVTVSQLGTAPDILLNVSLEVDVLKEARELPIDVTTNVPYTITSNDSWITQMIQGRSMVTYHHSFKIEPNTGATHIGSITIRSTGITPELVRVITIKQHGPGGDVVIVPDILYRPIDARVSDLQYGSPAGFVYDGDLSTFWHSNWKKDQPSDFPKYLECDLPTDATSLDYLIVRPRGGNGDWGKVTILYNTREVGTWTKLGDYDFKRSGLVMPIYFATPLQNVKTVRFEIQDGVNGNATCREVEFYKYNQENTLESSLAKVFTTTACMAVRAEATDKDIAALPEMFQNVAVAMRKGTYNPEFRMGTYKAFSSPEKWAGIFKSRKWGQADNPTGIWAKKGDEVVVCVGNVWGQHINLFSCDAYQGAWGDNYMLKSGVNKITILNDGLLYVKYYVDDLHNPDAKPIEVHFPEGSARVNGYWDVAQHKTNSEYERIMHLSKDPFHMFDIVGLYSHLIYPREFIPQYQIVKAFEWYDKMCWWDWEIMGLDKLYTQGIINHRHVFIAGDIPGKFMNASDYRTYYNQKTLMERLNEATMKRTRDLMWGPAHEMGHMHQYVFNFHGYTEASNNFFSNLFVYKSQWGFKSRGQGAQTLIDAGFAYQDQMINAGTDQKPEWNIYPRTPFLLLHRVPVQGTDIMLLARMNWQLYTYFHIAGKDTEFWPKYFELLRQGPSFGNSESEAAALNLYVMACEAAKLDLTDFFEAWGFFVPLDFTIYDYIEFHHCMTQEMIDAAKAQVKAKNYPKAGPIEYIEDRDVLDAEDQDRNFTKGDTGYWTYYRDNAKIKSNISVAVTANNFAVTNWEGAAAFEIWDLGVVKFKTVKKGFTVPTKFITPTSKLYAVQVDGQRIAIWPK